MLTLTLPYPPTTGNHQHGRTRRGKMYTLPTVKAYRHNVWIRILSHYVASERKPCEHGAVALIVLLHPPDARRRDADNAEKLIFDALVRAGVIDDDSCIRRHTTEWRDAEPPAGRVVVTVRSIEEEASHGAH